MKKILSLMLALCMVIGVVPAVFAAETADVWDGTADTSWYNDTDTEFTLATAEQLAGLASLVNAGNTFAGKTVKLGADISLYKDTGAEEPMTFTPIGNKAIFEGTFDGQGHTISDLYQSGWALGYEWGAYGSVGLFGEIKNATVKNLTISGAECFVEGGDVGGITGSATGTCVFENITITDSAFATYNNGCGGIIAWSGAGSYTFKNIKITSDVTLAGLWGSFDSSIGGVVGQGEPGATYNFDNVEIACRLDVYNDCTASYDYYIYRMCGMIIGRLERTTTIDGKNYPDMTQYNINCKDVTVTYGEWRNYHYCEPTPGYNNGRGMRVEPGYAYDGLPADYDHSGCTLNHMNLIPFNQLFGGAQYGVTGQPTNEGVTVHEASDTWSSDGTSHWLVCLTTGCNDKIDYARHTSEGWKYDGVNHWKECSVCKAAYASAPHTAGDWIVDVEATEEVEGARHKECTVCKVILETESIDKVEVGPDWTTLLPILQMMATQRYSINVEANDGGTAIPSADKVKFNGSATVTIIPNAGYEIASVTVNGKPVEVKADGTISLKSITKTQNISVEFAKLPWVNPYADVSADDPNYEIIKAVSEAGLINGIGGNFAADEKLTSAMFVTILGRLHGVNAADFTAVSFTDVVAGEWYAPYVEWACANGITNGTQDGTIFGVDENISIERAVTLLARYAHFAGLEVTSTIKIKDENLSDWAADAMAWAIENGIYVPAEAINPQAEATRMDIVKMVYNLMQILAK